MMGVENADTRGKAVKQLFSAQALRFDSQSDINPIGLIPTDSDFSLESINGLKRDCSGNQGAFDTNTYKTRDKEAYNQWAQIVEARPLEAVTNDFLRQINPPNKDRGLAFVLAVQAACFNGAWLGVSKSSRDLLPVFNFK